MNAKVNKKCFSIENYAEEKKIKCISDNSKYFKCL